MLGQSFTPAGLAAVSGLERAGARRLASGPWSGPSCSSRRVDPRSPERGQYAFVQALIREVAYTTLSLRDRRVAPPRRRPLLRVARRRRARRRARRPLPRGLPGDARRRRRPTRSRPRRGSRSAAPPSAPSALGACARPSRSSSRRSRSRRTTAERADLLERIIQTAATPRPTTTARSSSRRELRAIREAMGDRSGRGAGRLRSQGEALYSSRQRDQARRSSLARRSPQFEDLGDDPTSCGSSATVAIAGGLHAATTSWRRDEADRALAAAERLGTAELAAGCSSVKGIDRPVPRAGSGRRSP